MYEEQRLTVDGHRRWSVDSVIFDAIVDFLPRKSFGRVLDYGAGNSPYREYFACEQYIKADITQNINADIDCLIIPDKPLDLPDHSFECILVLDVLEHVTDPVFVLRELRRLLKPGGSVILSLPFLYREHETPNDYVRYTAFGIQMLVATNGGRVVRLQKVGNLAYTLLTLWLERGISNGERVTLGTFGRLLNRLLVVCMFPFSKILAKRPLAQTGIYHHLLLEIDFT